MRLAILPEEANSPLVIDANTMLSLPVTPEHFEAIAGRYAQVFQPCGGMQEQKFSSRHFLEGPESKYDAVME